MERPRFWLVFLFNSRRLYPIAWCRPCGRPRDMEHIAGAALAAGLIPPDDDIRWPSSGSTCRNRAASSHQRNRRVETEQRAAICRICAICVRKRFLCSHYFSFWADICSFFTSLASGRVRTRQSRAPPTMTADDDQKMLPIVTTGDTMAPATNDEAPKMALAAPALSRSLSMAIAVLTGCIIPNEIII